MTCLRREWVDKRQQRCFWADVKERVVWGGGRSYWGALCACLCVCQWVGLGRGLGFEAQWRKLSKYNRSLLWNGWKKQDSVVERQIMLDQLINFYRTFLTWNFNLILSSLVCFSNGIEGKAPPGKLQGASYIIELRRCVTAQNLSKQFCICNCCLWICNLLWQKCKPVSVLMCHPTVCAQGKQMYFLSVCAYWHKVLSDESPSDILDN